MALSVNITTGPRYSFSELAKTEFWKKQFPEFSINSSKVSGHNPASLDEEQRWLIHERILNEGYFGEHDTMLAEVAPRLAEAVEKLVKLNIPPVFLFIFDEAWECFYRLHPVFEQLLGPDYKMLPDFWAWHVKPELQESGWKPHRDKGRRALAKDGSPLSVTMWIPLSEANPLNSCIYVVPSNLDPTYNTDEEWEYKPELGTIRALPGKPGDYFCWNQSILHWGSRSSPYATQPRISMAFEFQRGDTPPMNEPLLTPLKSVPFIGRLKLIAKQILQYDHMYKLPPELKQLATQILEDNS